MHLILAKSINLSSFDTSNITDMSWMFLDCAKLKNLDLSSFDTSKVTDMSSMFEGAEVLEEIKVSSKWTTANLEESKDMFKNCGCSEVTIESE